MGFGYAQQPLQGGGIVDYFVLIELSIIYHDLVRYTANLRSMPWLHQMWLCLARVSRHSMAICHFEANSVVF